MPELVFGLFHPLMAAAYGAVFLFLWLRSRGKIYILGLAVADALVLAGATIEFFLPQSYELPLLLTSQPLYHLSTCAFCWALCQRMGPKPPLKMFAAILATTFTLAPFASIYGRFDALLFILNFGFISIMLVTFVHLNAFTMRSSMDRAILILLGFYVFVSCVRPLLALIVEPVGSPELLYQSLYFATMLLASVISIAVLSTTLVAAILIDEFRAREESITSDALTGLKTRGIFEERAREMLELADAEAVPVSMIVGDIDHFKQVNDLWGHQTGDEVIQNFAAMLSSMARSTDLIGRIGGEEFCIIVWDCGSKGASGLADRIRQRFGAARYDGIGDSIRISASFGVSERHSGDDYGRLFARADAALYLAKSGGRDCVVVDGESAQPIENERRVAKRIAVSS